MNTYEIYKIKKTYELLDSGRMKEICSKYKLDYSNAVHAEKEERDLYGEYKIVKVKKGK